MRFLMLVCRDESIRFSPEQRATIGPEVEAWVAEMTRRGVRLQGDVLEPVEAAAVVRVRIGDIDVVHGSQLVTTAPVSGFNLIECADLEEAVEVSAQHPIARFGTIELRPIAEG